MIQNVIAMPRVDLLCAMIKIKENRENFIYLIQNYDVTYI